MAQRSPREVFHTFIDALTRRDWKVLQNVLHADFVEEYPQSGERIRGFENLRAILENYPGGLETATLAGARIIGTEDRWVMTPSFNVVHIVGTGDTYTGVASIRYPDGSDWYLISLARIRDGKLWRAETYFASKFDAPDWRSRWVERVEAA